jgi:hypothetical protein
MALIVGAKEFDRLFPGVQFSEIDGDILFVFALDEETAAEMEDKYSLHISIIASDILKTDGHRDGVAEGFAISRPS